SMLLSVSTYGTMSLETSSLRNTLPSVVIPTLERFCLSVFTTSLRLDILILAILKTSMGNEKDNRKQLQRSHIRVPLYIALFGQCINSYRITNFTITLQPKSANIVYAILL